MRIGNLRHQVSIQQLVAGSPQQTASGEPDETWTDYAVVRASIDPLMGREVLLAQSVVAGMDVRIRTWYLPGVTAGMRIKHDENGDGSSIVYYDIITVANVSSRSRELELMCKRGLNDG